MKITLLPTLTFIIVNLIVAGVASAQNSPLAQTMSDMLDGQRAITRLVSADINDTDKLLSLVYEFQGNILKAKTMLPPGIDASNTVARTEYVKMLGSELLGETINLETAIISRDKDAALGSLRIIKNIERDGHALFRPEN